MQQYTSFSCIWCLHIAIDSILFRTKQKRVDKNTYLVKVIFSTCIHCVLLGSFIIKFCQKHFSCYKVARKTLTKEVNKPRSCNGEICIEICSVHNFNSDSYEMYNYIQASSLYSEPNKKGLTRILISWSDFLYMHQQIHLYL